MADRGMAEKIVGASGNSARTIVLIGSLHAMKDEIEWMPGVNFAAALTPDSLSLIAIHDGGTSWSMTDAAGTIREAPPSSRYRPDPDFLSRADMGWVESLGPAFDGYYYLGTISASPPVLPNE